MTERTLRHVAGLAAVVVGLAGAVAGVWGLRPALSVAAGGAWNLASLWCLGQLLQAWLGPQPSRRRVIGWLLVKFPLLYLLAFGVIRSPLIAPEGFGAGFTVVLAAVVGWYAFHLHHLTLSRSHGP